MITCAYGKTGEAEVPQIKQIKSVGALSMRFYLRHRHPFGQFFKAMQDDFEVTGLQRVEPMLCRDC